MIRKNKKDNIRVRDNMNSRKLFISCVSGVSALLIFGSATAESDKSTKKDVTATEANIVDEESSSIWESNPIEINAVNVQVLDKISGKVLKKRVKVGEPLEFGGIQVTLKRCFKNAPEDSKEIYAFVEIGERKSLFARWLFASSPSVNIFEHPQYDVRVGF